MTTAEMVREAVQRKRLPTPAVAAEIRRSAGLSREELAEAMGVTRMTVWRYETGRRSPRGERAARYREALDALQQESFR